MENKEFSLHQLLNATISFKRQNFGLNSPDLKKYLNCSYRSMRKNLESILKDKFERAYGRFFFDIYIENYDENPMREKYPTIELLLNKYPYIESYIIPTPIVENVTMEFFITLTYYEPEANTPTISKELKIDKDDTCCICEIEDKKSEIIFKHQCKNGLCEKCLIGCNGKCPMCRENIRKNKFTDNVIYI